VLKKKTLLKKTLLKKTPTLKKTPHSLILVALVLSISSPPPCAAQSAATPKPTQKSVPAAAERDESQADEARAADEQKRQSMLADLRALEAESKELRSPLDAASAKAEIAAAAWTLEREWAKRLLREALPLTFPEEVDRPKIREHALGARLQAGPLEDRARGPVRARILKLAAADPAFARELADSTARELGVVQEVEQYTQMASAAAREGRVDDAAELIRHAIQVEPTLINIGSAINGVAAQDRDAADRLTLEYINALRALPLSVFTDPAGDASLRVPISFMSMLNPGGLFLGTANAPPPRREVIRAYISFVMETMTRADQAHADVKPMWAMLGMLWPYVAEYAPELAAQFNTLERVSRRPGARPPALQTLSEIEKGDNKRYEERLKAAKETKDPVALEMAATSAMHRNDFDEARRLVGMLKDEHLRAQLSEMADEKESVYLTNKGELVDALKLARQLTRPDSVMRAYPPLIGRLAKNGDASSAQFLAYEGVRVLKASAEKEAANDTYVPSILASFASSIRIYKQSPALSAMSELALAIAPSDGDAALDVLDALAETANKARITSEFGSASFNADAFAKLAVKDGERVRSAASRFEDRLQRIVALASAVRGEAEALNARKVK
jgi:hypothetical protein